MQLGSQHSMDWAPGTPVPPGIVAYIVGRVQRDDALYGSQARTARTHGGPGLLRAAQSMWNHCVALCTAHDARHVCACVCCSNVSLRRI